MLQVVRRCRWLASAPFAARLVFIYRLETVRNKNLSHGPVWVGLFLNIFNPIKGDVSDSQLNVGGGHFGPHPEIDE